MIDKLRQLTGSFTSLFQSSSGIDPRGLDGYEDFARVGEIFEAGVNIEGPEEEDFKAAQFVADMVMDKAAARSEGINSADHFKVQAAQVYRSVCLYVMQDGQAPYDAEACERFVSFAEECKKLTQDDMIKLGSEAELDCEVQEPEGEELTPAG